MYQIFIKEINTFFSSLIGYIAIGVFLIFMGLMLWVFPDTSLLNYNYASLGQLFELAPLIFLFLIPAVTMRLFAEENQTGTIELLATKPLTDLQIISGKFFAALVVLAFSLLPTLIYYYSVYKLGDPVGNIDSGATMGSYFGLFMLGAVFVAIGIFASSISQNQVVAFILAAFLSFFFYWGFRFISKLPVFVGRFDDVVERMGIDYHYTSISRGVIDTRDLIYFITVIFWFLLLTKTVLTLRRK